MGKVNDPKLKNIYIEKPDEVYRIEISNGFRDDGTRDRIIEYSYGSEEDAIKKRDKIKEELKEKRLAGMKVANDGYTLTEASKMFLEDRNYKKRSGTTITSYKRYLNDYILPEFGYKKLRNITEKDIGKLLDKMRKHISQTTGKPLSGTTVKHAHSTIRAIYNYAIHKKWLLYNPALHINNKPVYDTAERDYYDSDDISKIMEYLEKLPTHSNGLSKSKLDSQNIRFKTAIIILFNTGLRREELIGLKWKDINFKTNVIEIRRAVLSGHVENYHPDDIIEQINQQLICKDLKTAKSRRNIVIPKICLDLLNEYKKNQIQNGKDVTAEDYIFQTLPLNSVWDPNRLTKEWKNFIDKNGLKKITVHDIRHSHATYLLSIGIPLQDVSRRIGHSDVGTTLKVYTHSNLEQDKKIISQLENNLYSDYNKEENTFDLKVIASIITGVKFASDEDIYNCLEYLTKDNVNENDYDSTRLICKNYILEKHSNLNGIDSFINENTSKETNEAFFGLLKNDANIYILNPILEIDRYAIAKLPNL